MREKGLALPLILILLMVAGEFVATKLVDIPQIFKSQAGLVRSIYFVGPEIKKDDQGMPYTQSIKVNLALTSPFGYLTPPPNSTPIPDPMPTIGANPIGACFDNPCDKGSYCIQMGNKQLCIPSMPSSATSSGTVPKGRETQSAIQDFTSWALGQIKSLTRESGRLAVSDGVDMLTDATIPRPRDPEIICSIGNTGEPIIKINPRQPDPDKDIQILVDNATFEGWNNNCDAPNSGDLCLTTREAPEINIEQNQVYNVWLRTKKNGKYSLPTTKFPIICTVPGKVTTVGYRLAENPVSLKYSSFVPYNSDSPIFYTSYVFQNIKPGLKTVWVQFLSNDGRVSNPDSADIQLKLTLPTDYCDQKATISCKIDGTLCENFPTPCDVPSGWIPPFKGSPDPLPTKKTESSDGYSFEIPWDDLATPTPRMRK